MKVFKLNWLNLASVIFHDYLRTLQEIKPHCCCYWHCKYFVVAIDTVNTLLLLLILKYFVVAIDTVHTLLLLLILWTHCYMLLLLLLWTQMIATDLNIKHCKAGAHNNGRYERIVLRLKSIPAVFFTGIDREKRERNKDEKQTCTRLWMNFNTLGWDSKPSQHTCMEWIDSKTR